MPFAAKPAISEHVLPKNADETAGITAEMVCVSMLDPSIKLRIALKMSP